RPALRQRAAALRPEAYRRGRGRRRTSPRGSEVPRQDPAPCASVRRSTASRTAPAARISCISERRAEDALDQLGHGVPGLGFRTQSAAPGRGEPIVPGLALVLRFPPLAGNPPLVFQAIQGGIERPLAEGEGISGELLEA